MKRILFGLGLLLLAGTAVFAFSTVFGSRSALVVSPDHLEFGDIAAGESERRVVVVTNTSDETIAIERIEASPPFGVARDSLVLGARMSRAIMVTFSPDESGRSEGQVTLESALLAGGTRNVRLEGDSHGPAEIAVDPLFLSFGEVRVGETGKASITVANRGEVDLELASLATGRPFRAVIDSTSVAAGTSRILEVYFEPTLARDYDRSLTIRSNDPERSRVFVAMDGTGVDEDPAPRIQVSPANLEFGSVVLGKSQTRRVSIRNGGDDPLTLTALLAPANFAVPTRSRQIQPGEKLDLPVSFSPGKQGAVSGALRIFSNDPGRRELTVAVRGAGQTRGLAGADSEGSLAGSTRAMDDAAGGSRSTDEVLGGPWAVSDLGGNAAGNGEAAFAVAEETAAPEAGQEPAPEEEQPVAMAPNPTLEGGEVRLDSYPERSCQRPTLPSPTMPTRGHSRSTCSCPPWMPPSASTSRSNPPLPWADSTPRARRVWRRHSG